MSRPFTIEMARPADRLPEPGEWVMVWIPACDSWEPAAYNTAKQSWGDSDAQPITEEITWWYSPPPDPDAS